jgi:alanine racemase
VRPTWAEIDLGALAHNLAALRERAGGRRVIAVVKADAYGHGAVPVSGALARAGCDALAVATLDEALALRRARIELPLLLLEGPHADAEAQAVIAERLTVALARAEPLAALEAAAAGAGRALPLHLKIDTGMSRLGFPPEQIDAILDRIAGSPWLELEGVMSHLADADRRDAPATAAQRSRFASAVARVHERGLHPAWIHLDNSPGVWHGPTPRTTAIRPGLSLYGPDPTEEGGFGLEPVMTLATRVLALREVPAGTRVGYGGTHVTERAARLATVPLGYADGLPRAAGNAFRAALGGVRVPFVGRVSMDLATLDVTCVPRVAAGDEVLVFGRRGVVEIRVEELARTVDTIPYEILVRVGARVPRVACG